MDKELPLIISEMLIKQDETTSQIKEVASQVKEVVTQVEEVTTQVKEVVTHLNTVTIQLNELTTHVSVLTTHFNILTTQVNGLNSEVKETNTILRDFMGMSVKQWEQQHIFNEAIVNQLKEIKITLADFAQLESRLKAVEERESKLESRIANIERMLKAS